MFGFSCHSLKLQKATAAASDADNEYWLGSEAMLSSLMQLRSYRRGLEDKVLIHLILVHLLERCVGPDALREAQVLRPHARALPICPHHEPREEHCGCMKAVLLKCEVLEEYPAKGVAEALEEPRPSLQFRFLPNPDRPAPQHSDPKKFLHGTNPLPSQELRRILRRGYVFTSPTMLVHRTRLLFRTPSQNLPTPTLFANPKKEMYDFQTCPAVMAHCGRCLKHFAAIVDGGFDAWGQTPHADTEGLDLLGPALKKRRRLDAHVLARTLTAANLGAGAPMQPGRHTTKKDLFRHMHRRTGCVVSASRALFRPDPMHQHVGTVTSVFDGWRGGSPAQEMVLHMTWSARHDVATVLPPAVASGIPCWNVTLLYQ